MTAILAIDAGTTGVTVLVVAGDGKVRARGYREITQHYPRPGWVEHDPEEIWSATQAAAAAALAAAGLAARELTAIGVTNQRETTVVWDRASLTPVHRAIVWRDRRTAARCDELRPHEADIRGRTGLVVDAYFSATKLEWLLREVGGLGERARAGKVAFGTIDSWIIARLTRGRVHATDASNASRTLLWDIYRREWDRDLLDRFGVPAAMLPEVRPSSGDFGDGEILGARVPIRGVAGDQQAALFGQGCFTAGMTKNTYGTGSFVLMNVGENPPAPAAGLLTTVAWTLGTNTTYALEGAIFTTGAAIQWLRDGLGIVASAAETGPLAGSVADAGGVYFVPALAGLGSPWWDPYARGTIIGITGGTTRAHLARAAVEAMVHQTRDVVEAMAREAGVRPAELRVDGGASVMDLLCQLQADALGVVVRRTAHPDATGLGAAYLAGLGASVWQSPTEVAALWQEDRAFTPAPNAASDRAHKEWLRAVERARGWALEDGA